MKKGEDEAMSEVNGINPRPVWLCKALGWLADFTKGAIIYSSDVGSPFNEHGEPLSDLAALYLIERVTSANGTEMVADLENVTISGEKQGNWQVIVRRKDGL